MKKSIQIDLSQPYEHVVASLLSLPEIGHRRDRLREPELRTIVRTVYEAANGRQIETTLGFLPIAPPVAEFLKAKPFEVTSQTDFLVAAAARIIAGPKCLIEERAGKKNGVSAKPRKHTTRGHL